MTEEYLILNEKLNSIIRTHPNNKNLDEFKELTNELYSLKNDSVAVQNNSFFSKMITAIRAKFFKPKEKEFDIDKYNKIKEQAIQLYTDKILKKEKPFDIIVIDKKEASFIDSFGNEPHKKLLDEIRKYLVAVARMREKEDGAIEIYPWCVDKDKLEDGINKEYLKISEKFLTTDCGLDNAFKERTDNLSQKNKAIRNIFMKSQINPYYGEPGFINERAKYILSCMETIISDEDVKEENKETTRGLIDEAREVVKTINDCKSRIDAKQNDETYDVMKNCIEKLLSYEDVISNDMKQIWNEFLTKPEDFKNDGSRFAFLVHTFSRKIVEADLMNKCCCTMVTDKCMPIQYGNVGIVCGFDPDNISTMCIEDAGSWVISQQEFFDRELPTAWQFAEKIGDDKTRVFYEYPKISKLILPTTMENQMIENNIKANENSNKEFREYTEVFMTKSKSGKSIPVQEMFYTNEKGKERAKKANDKFHPIMIDPSKGTAVPFHVDNYKDKSI